MKPLTIAIDGHSSTGKSTLARQLAQDLGYRYVDSGAMYRAVTLYALRENLFAENLDENALLKALSDGKIALEFHFNKDENRSEIFLNGENVEHEIREMEVSQKVSRVAEIPEVRSHLVEIQKDMGKKGGVVMDGRDIGTVVFPDADLKIFMTAQQAVRTQRRYEELLAKNIQVSKKEVEANLRQRDLVDSTRVDSPLKQAEDARVLDNSEMGPEEQMEIVKTWLADLSTSDNYRG